ncbi:GNAT family N-acetyltransferase [Anaeromicropila herbilytica]|uniref:N-acetyltransferase domain-containing protein n=1 Tax=Anaeromicropila herbilytica TaxID=2785025 RepID=A0A7R7ELM1_9FIRM|nr:GNAT family N-acetyltransferase [Anaeromicropila herbilytica]BCN30871.1 hypothetical protein bsdtb5_21660 [Anaeromicropila herbilytica]
MMKRRTSEIIFRSISKQEFEAYKEWTVKDYAESMLKEGQFSTIEEAIQESLADFLEGLPDGLDTSDNSLNVVENLEGDVIGFLWYETINKKRAFIEDIIIKEQYRRQGYGTAVLEKLSEILINQGIYRIVLHVFESNFSARVLYEKVGFTYLEVTDTESGSMYMAINMDVDRTIL